MDELPNGKASRITRRTVLKAAAIATATVSMRQPAAQTPPDDNTTGTVDSSQGLSASPPTTPYMIPLPVYRPKTPVSALAPDCGEYPSGEECGRDPHQRFRDFPNVTKKYELFVREAWHSYHPQMPDARVWGYDGVVPGPTFVARYGQPCMVRIHNMLPLNHIGFGTPEISTHLHNAHCGSESDGYTGNYFSVAKAGPTLRAPGRYQDHFYPNIYAGFEAYRATNGDPREALGTLWYHDHRMDFTAPNVYRGLAGFYLLFDEIDSGNERDFNPKALRLPSGVGEYDIPLVIDDKRFDANGQLVFDQFNTDGLLGDKQCINGKIQPYFRVYRRKYRFRVLNGSIARFYDLHLQSKGADVPFTYIANDGNLLERPLFMSSIELSPAERADIVVDFSKFPTGTQLFMVNTLEQINGRGPTGRKLNPGVQIMRFDIVGNPPQPDYSRVPGFLRALPPIDLSKVQKTRVWRFDRANGGWTVNDKSFDVERAEAKPKKGSAEIWVFQGAGDWVHPVHVHLEEVRILSRNGVAPPPHERGRKDVIKLHKGEEIRVYIQFRDYVGKYVMHCHNLTHEDHAMMVRFDVE